MSVDKLVDSTQLDSDLTSVANAIRTKGGTSAQLAFPAGFVSAIAAIPTGNSGLGYDEKTVLVKSNTPTVDRALTNFIFIAQVDEDEIPDTYPGNTIAMFMMFAYIDGKFIQKSGDRGYVVRTNGSTSPFHGGSSNMRDTSVGATSITFTTYSSQGMYRSTNGISWNVKQIELPSNHGLYSFSDLPGY